jgi:hypothetical protein
MSSNNNGIWNQWQADCYHQSSPKLADFLSTILPKDQFVLDFGCGNAFYISELEKKGFKCAGVEGFQLNNFLHDNIIIKDISQPVNLEIIGSVISLEVGEHLPKESEQIFLDNITKHSSGIVVLSWALPGQPGVGHINCQPQDYIIEEMERRNFIFSPFTTKDARKNIDDNTDWFRRTLLIFKKDE